MANVPPEAARAGASADTARDVRGSAFNFYTDEGNWGLVGNNIPVFFVHMAPALSISRRRAVIRALIICRNRVVAGHWHRWMDRSTHRCVSR